MNTDIPNTQGTQEKGNHLFPIFLKLENLETLVVGGGNVGLEKLEALLRNSPEAPITLVADFIKHEIY
jgi:siroheme synthase (precorrin-2 oxidase/ferrochelatase)